MVQTMKRSVLFLLPALVFIGSSQLACSQQTRPVPPPQRVEAPADEDVNEQISRSRQTAITRAVEAVKPAVVSVNVIEVRRVAYRDPFADPFFEFFGLQRR